MKPVLIQISLSSRFSSKVNNRARKDNRVSRSSLPKTSRDRIIPKAADSKEEVIRSREEDNRKIRIRRERVRTLETGQETVRKMKKMWTSSLKMTKNRILTRFDFILLF